MEEKKPEIFQIDLSTDEIRTRIIKNVLYMLSYRGVIDENDVEKLTKKLTSSLPLEDIYEVNAKEKFYIKLYEQEIMAINKNSDILKFLKKYNSENKILIVKEITNKPKQYIIQHFDKVEIFIGYEFMICLAKQVLVPKHILLNDEQKQEYLDTYRVHPKDMEKIFVTDPMARYFNAKLGQVFRVERPSPTSGTAVAYRYVVKPIIDKVK